MASRALETGDAPIKSDATMRNVAAAFERALWRSVSVVCEAPLSGGVVYTLKMHIRLCSKIVPLYF